MKFHKGPHKAMPGELPDPIVFKVADFSADIAPFITTMAIIAGGLNSAFGNVQEGNSIPYQHPVPGNWSILFLPDSPPPQPDTRHI